MSKLITDKEVVSEKWREAYPRHCPVVLRDGEDKSVGACWYYLNDGKCPSHGQIYESTEQVVATSWLSRLFKTVRSK